MSCRGDINHDGLVNGVDLSLLGSNWQTSVLGVGGDLNGDGMVNGVDLSLLGSNWEAVLT